MTEINKEIEEMARIIKFVQDSQVFHDGEADRKQIATALVKAGYRKQSETVKEFAEQLKKELFVNCVIIQSISNPQKEDMDSSEAFQIINELAEQYGKEVE